MNMIYLIDDNPASNQILQQFFAGTRLDVQVISDSPPAHSTFISLEHYTRPLRIGKIYDDVEKIAQKEKKSAIIAKKFRIEQHNLDIINTKTEKTIRLTEKEHHILQYLLQKPKNYASKEELLNEVWGYTKNIETHTLETHIYRLRQKIEENPSKPTILVTDENNGGYHLIA